jgi:hypothetical protein
MIEPGALRTLLTLLFVALILWRLYLRFRRLVGRQPFRATRFWISVIVFPLAASAMALASIGRPQSLIALVGSAAVGVALGLYGLKITRFEPTPEGLYYTPDARIGIALFLLLIGRLAYRIVQSGMLMGSLVPMDGAAPPPAVTLTPLTLLAFGPLAGYSTTYGIGLLRWGYSLSGPPAVQTPEPPG